VDHANNAGPTNALHISLLNRRLTRLERETAGRCVVCVNELPG